VIKNTGRTAARNVRLKFSPELDSAALSPDHSPLQIPRDIPVLVPGGEWRTFWDLPVSRTTEEQRTARYVATVSYTANEGEDSFGPYEFVLDWTLIINRGSTRDSDDPVKSLERVAKALEQLSRRGG
jgi:hypothetical protein